MQYVGAVLVAMLAGWLVDALLEPHIGIGVTLIVSFAISTVVFFRVRRWLNELRHH